MRLIPFAPLLAAAAWLAVRWDAIPQRWVIHWGAGGMPDGYASKSVASAFAPVALAVVLALALEAGATMTDRAGRARLPSLARAHGNLVRWMSLAVTTGVSVLAVSLPLYPPRSSWTLMVVLLSCLAAALGCGMHELWRTSRRMAARGERLPPGYGPFLYRNPEDPRLVVPKLAGVGWTLNFARPAAWLLLGVLLMPVLVVLVLVVAVS